MFESAAHIRVRSEMKDDVTPAHRLGKLTRVEHVSRVDSAVASLDHIDESVLTG